MSTANFSFKENTISVKPSSEDNTYRIGNEKTDFQSIDNPPVIQTRTPRRPTKVNNLNKQIETIKQTWNGIVIAYSDQELTVRLEDLTDRSNPDEIIVLSTEEIDKSDRPLIQKGSVFLWHIGYRHGPKYPRERFSKISFRRLPKWTNDEIQDANKLAKEYSDFFGTDTRHST